MAATASLQEKLIVGYWSIRGLGAPLRMMVCLIQLSFSAPQGVPGIDVFPGE